MEQLRYKIVMWMIHVTEDDIELLIRTNTGKIFHCYLLPSNFLHSPHITTQYFKCLQVLRNGMLETDDLCEDDATAWLLHTFEPLILQIASDPVIPPPKRATLSDYAFAQVHFCNLATVDENLQPHLVSEDYAREMFGLIDPPVVLQDAVVQDLDNWTRRYHPSDVEICYDRPEYMLIHPPRRVVVVDSKGIQTTCFYKPLNPNHTRDYVAYELLRLKKVERAGLPPDALVCRLHGVVWSGDGVAAGMLLHWIQKKCVLSKEKADQSSPLLRKRWADQICSSLDMLHERGLVWGDAKAENILIDENDDAWIIDFGGGYTVGWVDKENAGTVEGDKQGLARILDILGE